MIISNHTDADLVLKDLPCLVTIDGDCREGSVYIALPPASGLSLCTRLDGPYIGVQDAVMFSKLRRYTGIITLRNEKC